MKKKVLVVDDEPITVELIEDILTQERYEVWKAYNGTECLETLKAKTPDLVLLDIMMPDISGWDVYTRIRKKDKKLKVSFISAIEVSNERLKALKQHGLSDYITKPFTTEELVKRVKAILK